MNMMQINFYDESITVYIPENFSKFKMRISEIYGLDLSDVDELLIFYKDGSNNISISDDMDYQHLMIKNKNENLLEIYLEISEKSKLYQKEFQYSMISYVNTIDLNQTDEDCLQSTILRQEKLKHDIMKKEKLLKHLLEKERLLKEKKEKERDERERLEKEKLEREIIEKELEKKELLKQSLSKTIIDIVNSNVEKVRKELISNTIIETKKALNKVINNLSATESSKICTETRPIHRNIKCDGCGIFPILGTRYKCTVCFDFDYCENCEADKGDDHQHPFIKYRIPKGSKKSMNCKDKDQPSLFNLLKEKFVGLSKFFFSKEDSNSQKPQEQRLNIKNLSNNNFSNEDKEIKIDKSLDSNKEIYKRQMEDLKSNYFCGHITDDIILDALHKSKGNVDEALQLLF